MIASIDSEEIRKLSLAAHTIFEWVRALVADYGDQKNSSITPSPAKTPNKRTIPRTKSKKIEDTHEEEKVFIGF